MLLREGVKNDLIGDMSALKNRLFYFSEGLKKYLDFFKYNFFSFLPLFFAEEEGPKIKRHKVGFFYALPLESQIISKGDFMWGQDVEITVYPSPPHLSKHSLFLYFYYSFCA